jgi:hypothetical protein
MTRLCLPPRNDFYGGQVGGRAGYYLGALVVGASASVALGNIHQVASIGGGTTLLAPGLSPVTAPGNVFTQTTNIGRFVQDRFGVVPQAGLSLGYQLTSYARVSVGYDFLYVNRVLRPGDQIDRQVNPALPPILSDGTAFGASRPAPRLTSNDFWAQGLTLGVQLAY